MVAPRQPDSPDRAFSELNELRKFAGAPREFWPRFLAAVGALTTANRAALLVQEPKELQAWKKLVEWSADGMPGSDGPAFATQLSAFGAACVAAPEKRLLTSLDGRAGARPVPFVLATRLQLHRAEETCVAILLVRQADETAAREALRRLSLAADVPESYQIGQAERRARADVEKLAVALDLMVLLNAEKRFLAAAMAFTNGIATRFRCDRASLGWLERGCVRLRSISRMEKFDRKQTAAKALEVAMEEALDQDEEVLWPAPEQATFVSRDHQRYSQDQKVAHVCSLPLRLDGKGIAVLTCERQGEPFSLLELEQLRLCCDQAVRRLAELKHHDRWFGARWAGALKERLAKILGPEHTWAKVLALLGVALVIVLFLVPFRYRVEGDFLLRSDEVSYLTAPFDGYIAEVFVRPGDRVEAGGPLLRLDTDELKLEEVAALADWNRYQREAEKARAARSLGEMRVAEAMGEQAKARLDLIRYRLGQATLRAPFVSVLVEGDLRERIGAPVKQGDALCQVARIDTLYVEAEIGERDVHEILGRGQGEIAFVSQPKRKYPVSVVTVQPAAVTRAEGNIFLVRCQVDGGPESWWRPGMSGLCKLEVERRSLFWILTHRTVDFLRLKLWW